ncbi:hypothetical protein PYW08_006136 [Mythimna loreyi]|uniref:Uncharacterized protein n=1 Tax=Mythimna loreyi TaxID=667449 RepID=A0ACC2QM55_9NEOP|nr:hypothetical protein PYW08_006136 [Mythimna loreyi]
MRTSHPQYTIMVEFMEKYGDLSKPSGGPRGRHHVQQKWKELTDMLNSDCTGDSRTEEKWRKLAVGEEDSLSGQSGVQGATTEAVANMIGDEVGIEYTPITEDTWNTPGTSSEPTVAPPTPPAQPPEPTAAPVDAHWKPPKKRKKIEDPILQIFKECTGTAREYEREHDRISVEFERERIRQRDVELQLQAQRIDFMKEALKVPIS